MSFETLASHLALLNFFVGASISLPTLRLNGHSNRTFNKFSWLLFILGTIFITMTLMRKLYLGTTAYYQMPTLILACVISILSLLGCYALKMKNINAVTAPFTTILLMIYFLMPNWQSHGNQEIYEGFFLAFHVAGAVMGQIVAVCASLVAILFLWQQRLLKKKMLNLLTSRVPPQDILENLLVVCLWSGFLFLTSALLSGALYLWNLNGIILLPEYKQKIVWAVTVWIWYLAALFFRNALKIPMKRVAQMSLMGFMLLAVTFFGLAFI